MTSALGTGPVGTGTDESGSDAHIVAVMTSWAQYGHRSRLTPLTPAGAALESYLLVTTPVLQPGIYHNTVIFYVVGSAQGTDILIDYEIDGFSLGAVLSEAGVAGGGFVLPFTGAVDFTAGPATTHTFELLVGQPASPGLATAIDAFITWERKV